ncbi:HNH endonuclease [Leptospira idonii]|uniref:HNH nuclease domain-containing protein n=1 Tax=Leptospira idonii TaxID=1193500 RepID=A0A4R9LYM3_9LEPT|nr:HNH endonuclease signature motif containing protein [Leptospira idonii]TGN18457.1 hypothetical protein EHS15_13770 [Leptospira idonii]
MGIIEDALNKNWRQAIEFSKGTCSYCGIDLLLNRLLYATMQLDHIFPRSKYPDLIDDSNNLALSCAYCNHSKRDFDPAELKGEPSMLSQNDSKAKLLKMISEVKHLNLQNSSAQFLKNETFYLEVLKHYLPKFYSQEPT